MRKGYGYSFRLEILPILLVFFPLNALCQAPESPPSYYRQFTRFDVGYERVQYGRAPASNAVAIEFEKSFGSSRFSRNYRLSIGETEDNQFYIHIPAGTALGVFLYTAFVLAEGLGQGSVDKEPLNLLLKLPDGFGFTLADRDNLAIGMYANFMGIEYTNRFENDWDYAPDAGFRFNLYFNDRMFAFTRVSGKYSVGLAEWAPQATFGIGWDFGAK